MKSNNAKYYIVEIPIIYYVYIIIGLIILYIAFANIEVPIYSSVEGVYSEEKIILDECITGGKGENYIYIYTIDMRERWIIDCDLSCESKNILHCKLNIMGEMPVIIRYQIGEEKLSSRLFSH